MSRYEQALRIAKRYGFAGDDAVRAARHIFAKMIVGGATIGKVDGRTIVHKTRIVRTLP